MKKIISLILSVSLLLGIFILPAGAVQSEYVPDYDRERVYLTHIKKIYSWYNILVANNIVNFTEQAEENAQEATE